MINAKYLSPDAQFAFACFLVAEINRHKKDIENAKRDLERLREMGVDVARLRYGFCDCGGLDDIDDMEVPGGCLEMANVYHKRPGRCGPGRKREAVPGGAGRGRDRPKSS